MPKTFQAEFKGLTKFRNTLSKSRINKSLELSLGVLSSNIHLALESGVRQRYTYDGSLSTVLASRTDSTRKKGKNLLETDLIYRFVPVALTKFDTGETRVAATSFFIDPLRFLRKDQIKLVKKDYAKAATARVLRKNSQKTVIGRIGFGGFLLKAGFSEISGKRYRRGIYERQTAATWLDRKFGVSGIHKRAYIKPLYGPSLSQMARYIYENDPYGGVKSAEAKIDSLIMGHFNE